jgi:adenosine deaminase
MDDGVVYLELRTTPRDTGELNREQLIATITDAIWAFEAENPGRLQTRLILCVDRRHDLPTASSVLDLALRHRASSDGRDGVVVGLDLCGDPTVRADGEISLFDSVFKRATAEGLPITVHFAEAEASGSKVELDTLLAWNPRRLGHVIWEDEETKKEIAKRGLCLELCLSCNVQAGMIKGSFESHHFGHWKDVQGPLISLAVSFMKQQRSGS